jgi:Concanavalin A-like lectin/glucanases superfamily
LIRATSLQKPPFGTRVIQGHGLAVNLRLAMALNEFGGARVRDESNWGNHGSVSDPSAIWYPRNEETGLLLTGGKHILVPHSDNINSITSWTYSVRLSRTSTGSDNAIIAKGTASTPHRQIYIYFKTTNVVQIDIPFVAAILTGARAITDAGVHTVTVTKNGTDWRIYIDGLLDASTTSASAQEASTSDLKIGSSAFSSFAGMVYNAFIWHRALGSQEVLSLHADPYQLFARRSMFPYQATAATGSASRMLLCDVGR